MFTFSFRRESTFTAVFRSPPHGIPASQWLPWPRKLSDFGFARFLPKGQTCSENIGTPAFMAPEQHRLKSGNRDLERLVCLKIGYPQNINRQSSFSPSKCQFFWDTTFSDTCILWLVASSMVERFNQKIDTVSIPPKDMNLKSCQVLMRKTAQIFPR